MPAPRCGTPHPEFPDALCIDRGAQDDHVEHLAYDGDTTLRWTNAAYQPYVPPPKPKKLSVADEIKSQRDLEELAKLVPMEPKRRPSFVSKTEQATQEAIARAEANAAEEWKRLAYEVVVYVAAQGEEFTADEVWLEMERRELPSTHEPAALGPIFLRAARDGLIRNTGNRRKRSIYAHRHRELTIWAPTA